MKTKKKKLSSLRKTYMLEIEIFQVTDNISPEFSVNEKYNVK